MSKKLKVFLIIILAIIAVLLSVYFYENAQIRKLNKEYYNSCVKRGGTAAEMLQKGFENSSDIEKGYWQEINACAKQNGCFNSCTGTCGIYYYANKPYITFRQIFEKYSGGQWCSDMCVPKCVLPPK